MKKIFSKVLSFILITTFMFFTLCESAGKNKSEFVNTYSKEDIYKTAESIISWKKQDINKDNNLLNKDFLLNGPFLDFAGTTAGDWYVIAFNRLEIKEDYNNYLKALINIVENKYKEEGKLSHSKATEWHRISLAVLACGGDPANLPKEAGTDSNINLIADGVYNRGNTSPIDKQGLNGLVWGLIALDSNSYKIPTNSFYTRDDLIKGILKGQVQNGGFSLFGENPEVDITAMAITGLSTYYNSNKEYTFNNVEGKTITKSVKNAVDDSIKYLSDIQNFDGSFSSGGFKSCESTAQVIIGLTSLGIDIEKDERFIKSTKSVIDGLMLFKNDDGGFKYNLNNEDNTSNSMASEQALFAFASVWRSKSGLKKIYDFTDNNINIVNKNYNELVKDGKSLIEQINKNFSTEYLLDVNNLIHQLNKNNIKDVENIDIKNQGESTLNTLKEKETELKNLQSDIEKLNKDINQTIYSKEKEKFLDIFYINKLIKKYNSLSKYDKEKIENFKELDYTKLNAKLHFRSVLIRIILAVLALFIVIVIIIKIKRRKKKKDFY